MKRSINASNRGEGLIGIWWYTDDGLLFGFSKPAEDGYNDFGNIQYSKTENHLNLFRAAVQDFIEDSELADKYLSEGYKSLYRGRVFYETSTMCYVITCSKHLLENSDFRNDVLDFYNLRNSRYEFRPLLHYENKLALTGNPAIDSMYYEV